MTPLQDGSRERGGATVRVVGGSRLERGQTRTFEYEQGGHKLEGFLLHHPRGFFAFANICPHWNVDLDLGMGDFYAEDLDRIVCKNHGALFVVETGQCTAGPCAGDYLERFEVTLDGEDALVAIEPAVVVGGPS